MIVNSIFSNNGRFFHSLTKDHLELIRIWRNRQMEVLRQWKPLTIKNQDDWFQTISNSNNQAIMVITSDPKGDKVIGYCGLTNIDFINRRAEISFLVNPKRVIKKSIYKDDFNSALSILCEYGFNQLNLHKIFTETFDHRRFHIKILELFGFHKDGVLPDHQFYNGTYHNSIMHSLLSCEFKKNEK
jgi:RimJ/RimL family protein N-acetyltransferase